MTTLINDIKYGIRVLKGNPGFTAVAVLSLALGIGANTAIFSLLNAVWLRRLPVSDPHALRMVNWSGHNVQLRNFSEYSYTKKTTRSEARISGSFPYPLYRDFKEQLTGEADVFAYYWLSGLTVVGPAGATTTGALMVSGDFFPGYGAKALIGRTLTPKDESPSAAPVAVITYRLWERQFDLDPQVLGRVMTVNQQPFTIVGVLPRFYSGPMIGDQAYNIYVPMSAQPQLWPDRSLESRDHWWVLIMARLHPQTRESQVAATMQGLFLQTLSAPGQSTHMDQPRIVLEDGSRGHLATRRYLAQPLGVLLAAVGLVLLIACTNLAGLLLARGVGRQQELIVRAALGAPRARLVQQLLTESLILAVGGAVLGLLVGAWMKGGLVGFLTDLGRGWRGLPRNVAFEGWVLFFTLGVTFITVLLFGLIPALCATQVNLNRGLKGSKILGVSGLRLGKLLVAGQVGLSVVLVVGTGLLLQTLIHLYRIDPGFNPENLLVFNLNSGQAGYNQTECKQFFDRVQTAIAGLPGVQSVALSGHSLLSGTRSYTGFRIPGHAQYGHQSVRANILPVSHTFFQTMGIPLLRGRPFAITDTHGAAPVVIVNQTFAQTCFPGEDPLGRLINDCRIVGLCGDSKHDRIQGEIQPTVYRAHSQYIPCAMCVTVRSVLAPLSLTPAIHKIVADLDRSIPVNDVTTQRHIFKRSIGLERLFTTLCGVLACIGLLLSCIGLYGLLALTVAHRTSEIGVRMALGARPRDVASPVIRSALALATLGLVVGIPVALGLTRVLHSLLFGVIPRDPLTIVASAGLMLAVAVLAAWIPARRAARINPMEALRCE